MVRVGIWSSFGFGLGLMRRFEEAGGGEERVEELWVVADDDDALRRRDWER